MAGGGYAQVSEQGQATTAVVSALCATMPVGRAFQACMLVSPQDSVLFE